jgi:hypothetical protein
MSTNILIISDALLDLGVINESETPSAEQGSHALRVLNQMLEAWEEEGVRLGWSEQTDTSADAPLPPYALKGVTAALALDLAPSYGGAASISPALTKKYDDGMALIYRKAALKNLKPSRNTRAVGEGQRTVTDILNDR